MPRPPDATLSVTKAARLLGVHPNTVRAWSDAGRLRYYRINPRGDRRYRPIDLQRFLAAAESPPFDPGSDAPTVGGAGARRHGRAAIDQGAPGARSPVASLAAAHERDLAILDAVARLSMTGDDLGVALGRVAATLREALDLAVVAIWEERDGRLIVRTVAADDPRAPRLLDLPRGFGVLGRALDAGARLGDGDGVAVRADAGDRVTLAALPGERAEVAVAIPGPGRPWGVILLVARDRAGLTATDQDLIAVVAANVGGVVEVARRRDEVDHLLHRAEALRRVASDIGSRLDLDRILAGLVDHSMVLFEADRAAVFLRRPDGEIAAEVSRGLSSGYLAAARVSSGPSLSSAAVAARRPLYAVAYRDDPRGESMRAAVVQEGFDTLCTAPLMDGTEVLGLLEVYHDRPHAWSADELETMAALATQASVAIRAAQDYGRMSTWAAQLQSIQQLGVRLNRVTGAKDIGLAIATELRQLIDYHNVRVYRHVDGELVPVAMAGQVGAYVDETPEQLKVAVGQGITGWVAQHRIAQNLPDAAADPRSDTVPGTEEGLDESMLLAPMLFEDEVVGVLVLSKLGLRQFSDDDLRLLVIYASIAAQALVNVDTTERLREQTAALERQVAGQRELLQVTETILTTLDGRGVLEAITDRLGGLIACDNIAIEVVDPATGLLTPMTARGIHAAHYLEPWGPGESGIATWVIEHNEAVYIDDERADPRVNHFRALGADGTAGSLIVVPLRGRSGAIGVLTIERLGAGHTFDPAEFDLVQLFAAQVSIALQNAEVFRAVEIRAQQDALTGLLNHGTFQEHLARSVRDGHPFGLIMLDLDDFREVNNRHGHQAGDDHLRRIARALGHAGRETDLAFRYGGDEFALILPGVDATAARAVAERARAALHDVGPDVTASIGVATFPADGASAADILLAADRACFLAKRRGRDRIATAAEGLALAAEFLPQAPTPVDSEAPTPA
ncbi:MAG: GAF domain-containing protein [Candidatus Limnocylindria bacterium]